jgi:hypothetical protein
MNTINKLALITTLLFSTSAVNAVELERSAPVSIDALQQQMVLDVAETMQNLKLELAPLNTHELLAKQVQNGKVTLATQTTVIAD